MSSALDALRDSSLLGNLDDREVADILRACRHLVVPTGAALCMQDQPGTSMFMIVRGRVRIDAHDGTGQMRTLNYLSAGDHFGEMSMLLGSPRSATVTAVMETELLELSNNDFERTLTEIPRFAANLSRSLGHWLRQKLVGRRTRSVAMHVAIVRGCAAASCLALQLSRACRAASYPLQIVSDQPQPDDLPDWRHLHPDSQPFDDGLREAVDSVAIKHQRVLVDIDAHRVSTRLLRQQELILWVVDEDAHRQSASLKQLAEMLRTEPQVSSKIQIVVITQPGQLLPTPTPLPVALDRPPLRIQQQPAGRAPGCRTSDIARLVHRMHGIRLGIALGGGGARGMAHIGVLQVCEQAGIYFDQIAGTSAGAIIAAGYAAGMPIDSLLELFENEMTPPRWLGWLPRARQGYLLAAFRWGLLEAKFRRYLADHTFEQLLLPAQTVSVDLVSGQPRIRGQGDVVHAILESINHPIFGRPILRNGEALVDGGVLMNVPVAALRQQQADIVVAVDVGKKLAATFAGNTPHTPTGEMRRPNYFATLLRVTDVEQKNLATLHGAQSDLLIAPDTCDYPFDDFTQGAGLIEAGRQAAEQALPQLKQLLDEQLGFETTPHTRRAA